MDSKTLDDHRLQSMIDQTQFAEQDWWFSRARQKQLVFHLARDLFLDGNDPATAIIQARDFVDQFYEKVICPSSWEK